MSRRPLWHFTPYNIIQLSICGFTKISATTEKRSGWVEEKRFVLRGGAYNVWRQCFSECRHQQKTPKVFHSFICILPLQNRLFFLLILLLLLLILILILSILLLLSPIKMWLTPLSCNWVAKLGVGTLFLFRLHFSSVVYRTKQHRDVRRRRRRRRLTTRQENFGALIRNLPSTVNLFCFYVI